MNQDTKLNENMVRIRVTLDRMRGMAEALEADCNQLMAKNPKLFAILSEGPLDLIGRMRDELDELLEPLKHTSAATTPAPIVDNPISTPAAPGPIESAS